MNLAICHPIVIPARGGAETYVADLCRRLHAADHEVHLYACEWDADGSARGCSRSSRRERRAAVPPSLALQLPLSRRCWPMPDTT